MTAGCRAKVCSVCSALCPSSLVQLQRSSISVYARIKALKALAIGYKKVLTLPAVDDTAGATQLRVQSSPVDSIVLCKMSGHCHQWCSLASSPGSADSKQCHQCRGLWWLYSAPASMHIAWALCWDQTMVPLMRTIVQVSCTVQYSTVQHSTVQCTNEENCAGVLDTEVLAARAHQQRHHLHRYTTAHQSLVKQLPDQPHCRGQQVQLPAQRPVRHLDPADPLHPAAGSGRVPVPSQHGTQDINVSLSSCHRWAKLATLLLYFAAWKLRNMSSFSFLVLGLNLSHFTYYHSPELEKKIKLSHDNFKILQLRNGKILCFSVERII